MLLDITDDFMDEQPTLPNARPRLVQLGPTTHIHCSRCGWYHAFKSRPNHKYYNLCPFYDKEW